MAGGCAGGDADARHSSYMAAGHRGDTGIGGRGRRQGRTAHNVNELTAHRAEGSSLREPCPASSGDEHGHRGTRQTPSGA